MMAVHDELHPGGLPICDEHDMLMFRDEASMWYKCPRGSATLTDEEVAHLQVPVHVIRVTGCREEVK